MKNTKEISAAIQELSALTNKAQWTKRDEKRHAFLLSAVSVMKADPDVTLLDLERNQFNEESRAQGLPVTNFRTSGMTRREEEEIRGWQTLVQHGTSDPEFRDMTVGNPVAMLGTYTGLGFFVPTDFFPQFWKALQFVDFLFNPADVTYVQSTNGRPMTFPLVSDTENVATPVGEGATLTEADLSLTSHLTLGAFNYKTPIFISSIESWLDVTEAATMLQLFKDFSRDRFARGAGRYLVSGTGGSQPTGLLTQLSALNVPTVVASGSSANDGSSSTGATNVGTDDLAFLLDTIDPAYLQNPKTAWAMNYHTWTQLLRLKDKQGHPIVSFVDGCKSLFGFPVKICPNLPNMSASTQGAILLGDWSYWVTRVCTDQDSGVSVFNERYAEKGQVGMRLFARVDGGCLWDGDTSSKAPFVMLVNHS
jgi:HK97 family phage major capsid protein